MKVTVVKSNATVPSISGDAIPDPNDDYLFSVYQGIPFSIDLTFSLDDDTDPENVINVPINSISSSLSTYGSVSFTTIDSDPYAYTIRVSGTITNALPGGNYYILNKDNQIVVTSDILTPTGGYLAIVEWTVPTVTSVLMNNKYNFNLNYYTSSTYLHQMSQYVYWDFDPAIAQFKQVVANGEL